MDSEDVVRAYKPLRVGLQTPSTPYGCASDVNGTSFKPSPTSHSIREASKYHTRLIQILYQSLLLWRLHDSLGYRVPLCHRMTRKNRIAVSSSSYHFHWKSRMFLLVYRRQPRCHLLLSLGRRSVEQQSVAPELA